MTLYPALVIHSDDATETELPGLSRDYRHYFSVSSARAYTSGYKPCLTTFTLYQGTKSFILFVPVSQCCICLDGPRAEADQCRAIASSAVVDSSTCICTRVPNGCMVARVNSVNKGEPVLAKCLRVRCSSSYIRPCTPSDWQASAFEV